MANTFKAKNTEIYVGTIAVPASFDPSAKGNDKTFAEYVDDAITASTITGFTLISDKKNEISIEPAEDDSETRLFYGSDANGNQNSSVETTENNDVDVTLSGDAEFGAVMEGLALTPQADTNIAVADYKAYNLASRTTEVLVMMVKIERQIGAVFYMKTYLIEEPVFKQIGGITGASDDPTLSVDYALLGNKAFIYVDDYNDSTAGTYVNF